MSFPSGHAVGDLVIVGGLLVAYLPVIAPRWRTLVIALGAAVVVMIGVSRVVLNVHNPSDVLAGWSLGYLFPEPAVLLEEIGRCLKLIGRKLGRERSSRLLGIGVACPLSLEGWQHLLGIDEPLARAWSGIDFRAAVSHLTELPVTRIASLLAEVKGTAPN